ncbi:BolA/IbaG family iron-sulfur metabolism protein [Pelagibacterales bacterium SAG-MED39]|nr:BolA/IbaG family iron-sulfur metabolism protein [Pelagibacterales bacterium SAG-MED39]
MDIIELIEIVKKKLLNNLSVENIDIEDKSFLHKNHVGNRRDKFHLKITLKSAELNKMNKIESNKKIYRLLDKELKTYIHSLQILIH